MLKTSFYCLTIILFLLVYSGCSNDNRPKEMPRLFPVVLTITLDDQPLANAVVTFYTENESDAKWTVGSYTDANGKAIIVTHGQFHGAPAGKFKVCVVKKEAEGEGASLKVTNFVDTVFADPKSTPLSIEVTSKGKGMQNLTLNVHKP